VRRYDESTASLGVERMIQECGKIAERLLSYTGPLHVNVNAGRSSTHYMLQTSGGVAFESRGTLWTLGAEVERVQDTDILSCGKERSWRALSDLYDASAIADSILRDLRMSETVVDAPQGRVTAFFDPEVFAMLLRPISLGVNGRNAAKGDSPLMGRLGERILDPCLTITDDPLCDWSPGATEIDEDGVPARANRVVDKGRLSAFLYDLDSAALANAEPTGNNDCAPYNLEVEAGSVPATQLLEGIEDGLYVKGLMGFGQSNIMNGDFASNVMLGFRVSDGRITGRVKNAMIAGNVYELLRSGVTLSLERDPVLRLPSAVLEGVAVSVMSR
jgi:PmbA protein